MKRVFGIDLGTTNSCISQYNDGKFTVVPILDNKTTPSIVAYDGSNWLVGLAAANYMMMYPNAGIRSVKRKIGDDDFRFVTESQSLSSIEISTKILAYLKNGAEKALGVEVEDVVITVPAWFKDKERQATIKAGELAGLNVIRIVNEPTAAALAYDVNVIPDRFIGNNKEQYWLVYDLGGGTFDVSILKVNGDMKEVLSSCGNVYLGGDDFDRLIQEWMITQIKNQHNIDFSTDAISMAKLRLSAEKSKIVLSTDTQCNIIEVLNKDGVTYDIHLLLTRLEFNSMIGNLIDSSIVKVQQALADARLDKSSINRLLLVGGSTRIPLVKDSLCQLLDLVPDAYVDADLSVSLGAAVQAAISQGLTFEQSIVDVAPHSLGIAALGAEDRYNDLFGLRDKDADPYTFVSLIRRNTSLPARFVEQFFTCSDKQEKVKVSVYQGESKLTYENNLVKSFDINITPRPANSPIYIGFTYDLNGVVQVSLSETEDGIPVEEHTLSVSSSSVKNTSVKEVSNLLIEKIKNKLENSVVSEKNTISILLDDYKNALNAADDEKLDTLEDKLYSWLEA